MVEYIYNEKFDHEKQFQLLMSCSKVKLELTNLKTEMDNYLAVFDEKYYLAMKNFVFKFSTK